MARGARLRGGSAWSIGWRTSGPSNTPCPWVDGTRSSERADPPTTRPTVWVAGGLAGPRTVSLGTRFDDRRFADATGDLGESFEPGPRLEPFEYLARFREQR